MASPATRTDNGAAITSAKTTEALESQIDELKRQLNDATEELSRIKSEGGVGSDEPDSSAVSTESALRRSSSVSSAALPAKRGYLFKWQDRQIGWGGTKWELRFVCLEKGMLSYYRSHGDAAPRYVLTLRGCAVRDDGHKPNKRYKRRSSTGTKPDVDEKGAYFHVFSIYQRPTAASKSTTGEELRGSIQAENDDEDVIVPLLRFSTPSLAEKNQWLQLISEACAYCDSDAFLTEEAPANTSIEQNPPVQPMAKGTLPPMIFGTPPPRKPRRFPSHGKLSVMSKSYRKVSTSKTAAKSNPTQTSAYPPSKPMHREAAPSYLSDEAPTQNYRGLLNLGMIILVVSNFRLALDTVLQHGFVLAKVPDLSHFTDAPLTDYPFLSGSGLVQVFILYTYFIERLLSRGIVGERLGMALHWTNAHASLIVPMVIVWYFIENPVVGAILLMTAVITWMKLVSYVHANADYRTYSERNTQHATLALIKDLDLDETDIVYPANVTLSNIYYFWCAPTLTYQIAFPRSPTVRIWKIASLLVRLVITISLFVFVNAQVISPNLDTLLEDLEATEGVVTATIYAKYWLKLTIGNTYSWLLFFYLYFHLYLNLFAEMLRFGDRVFYKDWWNSSEVSAYWRLWNMPVHYWLVRHVYFPCIRLKMSKSMATFVVFFVSAVMHEVLISVPFHMMRPWAFLGMMFQIPLVVITKYFDKKNPGSSFGNIVFWMSFCIVGQPMAIMMYTIDYRYYNLYESSRHTHFFSEWNIMKYLPFAGEL